MSISCCDGFAELAVDVAAVVTLRDAGRVGEVPLGEPTDRLDDARVLDQRRQAALSVSHAVRGIVNISPSRAFFRRDEDFGLFFDPSDTAQRIKSTEEFHREFLDLDDRTALDYALADLWKITYFHYLRYQNVRRAAKRLLAALGMFVAVLASSLVLTFIELL